MIKYTSTAGMVWLSDMLVKLGLEAKQNGYAEAVVSHSWNYQASAPYPLDARPETRIGLKRSTRDTWYVNGQRVSYAAMWKAATK